MPEPTARSAEELRSGWGRTLVFLYGIFAVSATGRSAFQLATKADEALLPYVLSAVAAVVYLLATYALATGRRRLAWVTVGVELAGVLVVGVTSELRPQEYPDSTVWSDFGAGYGFIPLVLPLAGLAWLWHTGRSRRDTVASRD